MLNKGIFKKVADRVKTVQRNFDQARKLVEQLGPEGALEKLQRTAEDVEALKRVKQRISVIEEGRDILQFLEDNDIPIELDYQMNSLGGCLNSYNYHDLKDGLPTLVDTKLLLNPELLETEDAMVGALLHEAWHAVQTLNGFDRLTVNPPAEDYCLFTFVKEADAQSWATEMCYKLEQAGDSGAWEGLVDPTKDIFKTMVDMNAGYDVVKSGAARRTSFDFWFSLQDVKASYDRTSIQEKQNIERALKKIEGLQLETVGIDKDSLKKIANLSKVDYLKDINLNLEFPYNTISDGNKALIEELIAANWENEELKVNTKKPSFKP